MTARRNITECFRQPQPAGRRTRPCGAAPPFGPRQEMTNMRSTRTYAALAIAAAAALALAACSSSSSSSSGSHSASGGGSKSAPVTLTWWNNATANPLKGVYLSIISSFHASHPNVTITDVPIQNEQFTTKIPLALQSSDPPDIFQQWGGGQEATQIKSGKLENLTSAVSSW